jgi:hypothetical protein
MKSPSHQQYTNPCCSAVLSFPLQPLTRRISRSRNRKRDIQAVHLEASRLTEMEEVEVGGCPTPATAATVPVVVVPTRSPHISTPALHLTNNPWATLPLDGFLRLQVQEDFLVDHPRHHKATEARHHPEDHRKITTTEDSITVAGAHITNHQTLTDSMGNLVHPVANSMEAHEEEDITTTTNHAVVAAAAPEEEAIVVSPVVRDTPPGAVTATGDISFHIGYMWLFSLPILF